MDNKLVQTFILVVAAVAISGGLWVGSNLLFDQVRKSWSTFMTLGLGVLGFIFGVLLSGNRIVRFSSDPGAGAWTGLLYFLWFPVAAALVAAIVGTAIGAVHQQPMRTIVATVGIGGLGAFAGAFVRAEYFPSINPLALVAATAVVAGLGAGIAAIRKRDLINGGLLGGALGWTIGAWVIPDLGDGNAAWAVIAIAVPAALIGLVIGRNPTPDHTRRDKIDHSARAFTFVAPAVLFIFVTLVVPAIRTLILSFQSNTSIGSDEAASWVGFENYGNVLGRDDTLDLSGWANIFGSRLFWIGLILLALTLILGWRAKSQTGHFVELGSSSSFPMLGSFVFLAFAAFTALRGTLINNLWWVVVVVVFSTSLGLLVAVLADGRFGEKLSKSMIFMPMAISMVGASVIWRLMYISRDASKAQTGTMNAAWVGLGRLSYGSGAAKTIVGIIAITITVGLIAFAVRGFLTKGYGGASAAAVAGIFMTWVTILYWTRGVGGGSVRDDGKFVAVPIDFVQEGPFNNFWLMVVMIWIQTGFAMVILSAAINAVPDELLEAARVDGATPSQVFWKVTLPQIANTIGVVVTTLIVGVMKVFDIVKVMTNGQFGTQVLANDMINTSFNFGNFAEGSALAILILVLVLPVLVYNIYNMQKDS